jgi:hypothetical protein
MSDVPWQVLDAFQVAMLRASEKLPYVLGGGHSPLHPFQPSEGIDPKGVVGYDCSGAASDIVNRLDGLGHAMDTAELLTTPLLADGEGEFCTLWIAQYPGVLEHAAMQFKLPESPANRWFMAAYPGTTVGWFDLPDNWVTDTPLPYTPRRRK